MIAAIAAPFLVPTRHKQSRLLLLLAFSVSVGGGTTHLGASSVRSGHAKAFATRVAVRLGQGQPPAGVFSFNPSAVNFGNTGVGTTSQPITITATNNTSSTVSYQSSTGLGSFSFGSGTCGPVTPGTTLQPGQSCWFTAKFAPTAQGPASGSFTLSTASGPVTLSLSGMGTPAGLVFNPPIAAFGNVGIGTTSQPITVTAHNYTGSAVGYLSSTGLSKFHFHAGTCNPIAPGTMLAANSSCWFTVTFSPATAGPVSGSFTISTAKGPVTYHLSGWGVPAALVFTPPTVNFGNVTSDTTSSPVVVTVANYTAADVSYTSSSGLAPFHFQSITCGPISLTTTLTPGTSCQFSVTFSPTGTGGQSGDIQFGTTAGPVVFHLTGTGT